MFVIHENNFIYFEMAKLNRINEKICINTAVFNCEIVSGVPAVITFIDIKAYFVSRGSAKSEKDTARLTS